MGPSKLLPVLIIIAIAAIGIGYIATRPAPEEKAKPQPQYKSVGFTVHVPANTPETDDVYLLLLPFFDWDELQRIPMTANGDGTWSATAENLLEGALIRYVYDRGWEDWARWKATRENFDEGVKIEFRYLFISPTITSAEDTVARWGDIPNDPPTGTITGIVRDSATREPIMDATVSIGGVHTATNYDGSFTLDGIPIGSQRVTISTTLGNYKPSSNVVEVSQGQMSVADFDLEAAKKVKVTFNVAAPDDTPLNAIVKMVGNVYQLGSVSWSWVNQLLPDPARFVVMNKLTGNNFTATLELYEGTYVEYLYTLGLEGLSSERSLTGGRVLRSFVVGSSDETRNEIIEMWRPSGYVAVTFNVTVPPNTPPDEKIFMDVGGPRLQMDEVSKNRWTYTHFGSPGNIFTYKYFHGGKGAERFEPDDPNTYRSVTIPNTDTTINDTVERWRWFPRAVEPSPGENFTVTFRVTVPENTPVGDTIYLAGDSAELGNGQNPKAVEMTRAPTNDWLWEASVTFDSAKTIEYRYTRGDFAKSEAENRALQVRYDNQFVNDAVFGWTDIPFSVPRENFVKGIYPEDLWSTGFLPLYAPTLTHIQNQNAEWVVLSSVWSYGRIRPLPEAEPRPVRAGSVYTPTEDLIATINEIHSKGMKAFIVPQFNMEMTPEEMAGPYSDEWWDKWLLEAEKFYMYNAKIAERAGAEMLLLPGYIFHVFPTRDEFENPLYMNTFDQKMKELIWKVRQNYSGLLVASGSTRLYDFSELLDFVGTTSYGFGAPSFSPSASVQEIKTEMEIILDSKVLPIFSRYGKPIIIYQFAFSSVDLVEQANVYEAFFQAITDRPWVGGFFDFGYSYVELPLDETSSIRSKPAEAVLGKYYRAFKSS